MHFIEGDHINRTMMTTDEAEYIQLLVRAAAPPDSEIANQFIAMVDKARGAGYMDVNIRDEYEMYEPRRMSVKWRHVCISDSRSRWHFSSMHAAATWLHINHYTRSTIPEVKVALSRHVNKSTELLGFIITAERQQYTGPEGHYVARDAEVPT